MRSFLVLACLAASASAANWAFLVAGSNEYYNYRHQADVCHSYQVLIGNGFDPQNIVMMFYDDIANNEENPFKGNLINQPNGPNVYTNCVADYSKDDVTPQNFLKVLSGQAMNGVGSGRVIASTAEDNVFVFFSDHGATGLIAFPSDELMADDLIKTLREMHDNQQFKQMLFYLEACESGSMFNDLLANNWNILAVTASTPFESSYAIYFDDSRDTYLGDVFSVYWMQDSEVKEKSETIKEEFVTVRNETTESRVCSYGDESILDEMLSIFQSAPTALTGGQRLQQTEVSGIRVVSSPDVRRPLVPRGMSRPAPRDVGQIVDARDVELLMARNLARKLVNTPAGETWRKKALEIVQRRENQDARMLFVISQAQILANGTKFALPGTEPRTAAKNECRVQTVVSDYSCLRKMVQTVKEACGPFDHYSLRHVSLLNQFCNKGLKAEQLKATISAACFSR